MPTGPGESPPDALQPFQFMPPLADSAYRELKSDIRARGVQVPVEYDELGNILDGHHRVLACTELGISTFPRLIRSGMTEAEKQEHALSLNLHRRHLTRPQRQVLVGQLSGRGWSSRRIAAALGTSSPTVLRDLRSVPTSGASIDAPERSLTDGEASTGVIVGLDGKSYPARRKPTTVLARTAREHAIAEEALQELGDTAPAKHVDLKRLERLRRDQRSQQARQEARESAHAIPDDIDIRHCSIDDLNVPNDSVDLVLTDPPYTSEAVTGGSYARLGAFTIQALKPGGYLCAYAPNMFLPQALADLVDTGLEYWWTYAIVFPRHPYQVRQRALASGYRPTVVFRKPGNGSMPAFTMDVINGAGRAKDTDHPWQQGAGEIDELIHAFSSLGDTVVDPYCGSGTFGLDAQRLGRRFIGGDIDDGHVLTARFRLAGDSQETDGA